LHNLEEKMNQVLYYSLTGNTKKMATAMAAELGVEAKSIKTETAVPQDGLLFLGSGSYGDKPAEVMATFIANNDFAGRKVALFGTSGKGEGKEVQGMAEALKQKGANILGSYYCKGKSFIVVNIGHPGKDELDGARKFAREMVNNG
jgi:flavodoxin